LDYLFYYEENLENISPEWVIEHKNVLNQAVLGTKCHF